MRYLDIFFGSWKIVHNKKIIVITLIEFLFLILITTGALAAVTTIADKVDDLRNLQDGLAVEEENIDYNSLLFNLSVLSGILDEIVKIAIVFFIFAFIISGFFFGLNWKMCKNLTLNKKLFDNFNLNYILRFYLINFIWFGLFGLIFYLMYQNGFDYYLFFIILGVFFYFIWIGYSNFDEKKIFKSFLEGIKLSFKVHIFVPAFLIFIAILALLSYLFGSFNYMIISFISSLIAAFMFVWFRVFIIEICGKQDSNLRKH